MPRVTELMVIHDGELDDAAVQDQVKTTRSLIEGTGATLHKVDFWGRRRYAYPINHKNDGYYSVYEITAEGGALDPGRTVPRHRGRCRPPQGRPSPRRRGRTPRPVRGTGRNGVNNGMG